VEESKEHQNEGELEQKYIFSSELFDIHSQISQTFPVLLPSFFFFLKYELKLSVHSEYIHFQKHLQATPSESRSSSKQEAQQSLKQNRCICTTLCNTVVGEAGWLQKGLDNSKCK